MLVLVVDRGVVVEGRVATVAVVEDLGSMRRGRSIPPRENDCETARGSVMIRAVTGSGGCNPGND